MNGYKYLTPNSGGYITAWVLPAIGTLAAVVIGVFSLGETMLAIRRVELAAAAAAQAGRVALDLMLDGGEYRHSEALRPGVDISEAVRAVLAANLRLSPDTLAPATGSPWARPPDYTLHVWYRSENTAPDPAAGWVQTVQGGIITAEGPADPDGRFTPMPSVTLELSLPVRSAFKLIPAPVIRRRATAFGGLKIDHQQN